MKIGTNLFFQMLGMVLQYLNMASGSIPKKYEPLVALFLALGQALIAWRSHYYNTDGTPQEVAKTS